MLKSGIFGLIHVVIAFTIGYLLTGSLAIAGLMTFLEPLANTIAFYFFDRYWQRRIDRRRADGSGFASPGFGSAPRRALALDAG